MSSLADRRVVVVDDEAVIRQLIVETLATIGIEEVRTFCNGQEVLAAMKEGLDPLLIITDLRMPAIDGRALIQNLRIRRDMIELPIILMAGTPGDIDCSWGGFNALITKPINIDILKALVSYHLETASIRS